MGRFTLLLRGVFALALPTSEPAGQLYGFAANVACGHAFCSVVSREGICVGSWTSTDWMFAWPAGWLIVVSRLAPLALDAFPLVVALKEGLNASELQERIGAAFEGLKLEMKG